MNRWLWASKHKTFPWLHETTWYYVTIHCLWLEIGCNFWMKFIFWKLNLNNSIDSKNWNQKMSRESKHLKLFIQAIYLSNKTHYRQPFQIWCTYSIKFMMNGDRSALRRVSSFVTCCSRTQKNKDMRQVFEVLHCDFLSNYI